MWVSLHRGKKTLLSTAKLVTQIHNQTIYPVADRPLWVLTFSLYSPLVLFLLQ